LGTDFSASWDINYLSRDIPLVLKKYNNDDYRYDESLFGINFFRSINTYALNTRTVKYAILFLIGWPGPYPVEPLVRACSGNLPPQKMLYPDFRIGVCTQEPAHRFAGKSIINFLSNEDTGKRACFELAPGFFFEETKDENRRSSILEKYC
jgi:hypothetical protein